MTRAAAVALLAAGLAAALASPAAAELARTEPGAVVARICPSPGEEGCDGAAFAGRRVELVEAGSGRAVAGANANRRGELALLRIRAGQYRLRMAAASPCGEAPAHIVPSRITRAVVVCTA
ncbi:MAG: hypothetical protein ACKVWR_02985 [Acidimicrobiales bacterium]